jgi:hypothetical protein
MIHMQKKKFTSERKIQFFVLQKFLFRKRRAVYEKKNLHKKSNQIVFQTVWTVPVWNNKQVVFI